MKLFKIVLVVLVILVNLVVAQPSWADKPSFTENPEYIEVTKALDSLLKAKDRQAQVEGMTPEGIQQKITELQFQKYILETGEGVGLCSNETGKTIAVYGPKSKKSDDSAYENDLYLLADGQTTDEDWDCDGVYIPNNVKVTGLDLASAAAVKIVDGTQLVVKTNPETGAVELNVPPAKVFKIGEVDWLIPDMPQEAINRKFANAPVDD